MNRIRGFTLLELLMAMALLAVTLGLLLGASVRSTKQLSDAEAQNHAVVYAESLLDDLGYGQPLKPGRFEGVFADSRYRWQLRIERAEAVAAGVATRDAPMALYRVELLVLWKNRQWRWHTMRTAKAVSEVRSP